MSTEIIVCIHCKGYGYLSTETVISYHKGEYGLEHSKCYKCEGTGLLIKTTVIHTICESYKPHVPNNTV